MRLLAAALLLASTPVLAQVPTAQNTPNEQALLAEIRAQQGAKLDCMSAVIQLRMDIDKANQRIKELEALVPKSEPPKP